MANDEHTVERISKVLKEKHAHFTSKNMMGGTCFMVNDKMAIGTVKDSLMVRIDPELYDSALKRKGCRPMDFSGKPMRGFVFIDPVGYDMDKDLEYWIQLAPDFNPKTKASRKTPAKTARGKSATKNKKS